MRFEYTPPTSGEHRVGLCADFTGWRIIDMFNDCGVYYVEIELKPGRYLYKYVVDGMWIADPANPLAEPDPFGGMNSIIDFGASTPLVYYGKKIDDFEVPSWVKEGIIYQIFPDRFCNGSSKLNPDFQESWYSGSNLAPPPNTMLNVNQEYYHFVEDWYDIGGLKQNPFLPQGKPDWWSFYGGDIPGIIIKLDYLKDLGVTIIYLNPVWPAKSNHKYDAAEFIGIDPHLGTVQDMQNLVKKAHKNDMKVIIDVAFNHTGETFWAFQDCVQRGPESRWWNWYDWHKWPLPEPLPDNYNPKEFYQCWWGIRNMPDLNYDLCRLHPDENEVFDIRFAEPNQSLLEYLHETCRWWLIEIGIDGFRLDVPDEVPLWFWELWRNWVDSIKPDCWLVGEIWNNAQTWVNPKYFDSVMNYAYFKSPVHDYLINQSINLDTFIKRTSEAFNTYPDSSLRAMMNLLGSHDTWRLWEHDHNKENGVMLALVFQMTFVGVPHIYYGDEIGMRGCGDPDNRRPFDWRWDTDYRARMIRDMYKKLIILRKNNPCLIHGSFSYVEDEHLLRYRRVLNQDCIEVIINRGDQNHNICNISCDVLKLGRLFRFGVLGCVEGCQYFLGPASAVIVSYSCVN